MEKPTNHPFSNPLDNSLDKQEQQMILKDQSKSTIQHLELWRSKYSNSRAKSQIIKEAVYLGVILISIPVLMYLIWIGDVDHWLGLKGSYSVTFNKYAFAWLGGTLGGTLFAIKWLYHTVAKNEWLQDRLYWRIFSPHLSAALSFAIITLISSGILKIFDQSALNVPSTVVGLSFLCGYFSDSAIAKMTEVANTMFGTLNTKKATEGTKPKRDEEFLGL